MALADVNSRMFFCMTSSSFGLLNAISLAKINTYNNYMSINARPALLFIAYRIQLIHVYFVLWGKVVHRMVGWVSGSVVGVAVDRVSDRVCKLVSLVDRMSRVVCGVMCRVAERVMDRVVGSEVVDMVEGFQCI